MDSIEWNQGYRRCPRIVQEYYLQELSGENEDKAQRLLALDNDAWDRVSDPAWVLIFDGLSKEEFREDVKAVCGDHDPDEVERVLLQYIVFPVADMVAWDVEARLQELGVPASQLQSMFRISLRPMSYGVAARRVATNAKLSVLTEEVARRLREILISYLKGVRTTEQVKAALQQSQVDGGVGFSSEQADQYIAELEKLQLAVQIMSEQEYADWYANFQREENIKLFSKPKPGTQRATVPESAKQEDGDQADLPVIRPKGVDYDARLEEVIDETVKALAVTGLDEYLTKRLRNVISTRLRDVRNQIQVQEVLMRDSKVGGLDRHKEEAEAMAKVIEEAYASHRAELTQLEQARIEQLKQAQNEKRDLRRKQESEAHAEWYRQKVQEANPWAAVIEAQKAATGGGATSSVVATTPVMAGTVTGGGSRSALDAIRPPTRLTSLASELGGITLAEFRRLSKNPEESMERLWQKLETLKQESYERWQEGAQAWRQSPLQQQYLKIVAESFTSGRPVAEIANEQHEQDANQPTADEIGAILLMNNRLNV